MVTSVPYRRVRTDRSHNTTSLSSTCSAPGWPRTSRRWGESRRPIRLQASLALRERRTGKSTEIGLWVDGLCGLLDGQDGRFDSNMRAGRFRSTDRDGATQGGQCAIGRGPRPWPEPGGGGVDDPPRCVGFRCRDHQYRRRPVVRLPSGPPLPYPDTPDEQVRPAIRESTRSGF